MSITVLLAPTRRASNAQQSNCRCGQPKINDRNENKEERASQTNKIKERNWMLGCAPCALSNYFRMKFETLSGCRWTIAAFATAALSVIVLIWSVFLQFSEFRRRGYLLTSVNIIVASTDVSATGVATSGTYRLRCPKWVNRIEKVQIIQFQCSN